MRGRRRLAAGRPILALALSMTFVVGCGLLRKKSDAGAEGETPLPNEEAVEVAGSGAKNEKSVLRYKNEQRLDDEPGRIAKDVTRVRTFPGTGQEVATLSQGTPVVKKAKFFSTGVLVLFDDPAATDGSTLMGWVPPEALAAPAAATTATAPAVTAARTAAVDAGAASAAKDAAKDAGAADGGATLDAGALLKDAGVAVLDAGLQSATRAVFEVAPAAGKCPAGFALVGAVCRRPCNVDTDCPKPSFCTLGAGPKKTCSATR